MRLKLSAAELAEYIREVFPEVGDRFEILDLEPGGIRLRMTATAADLRPGGTVSGPAIFMLADCAFYFALLGAIGRVPLAVTTSASIDFMRKPAPGGLIAEARLLKLGRTLAVGDVLLFAGGQPEPIARASFTYSIPRPADPA
ncbi:PaaI family thioesterase [Amaricoccus solimangrovi]|uniref:PaaI family thioesterase n=1 Tax=Amaricoccus solimangrovi TaxID=2589815 RepID=A0A501WUD8_9RHOB|nr:PaaI family thioesterase [Amaricoccus solimangrovi]TPE49456.1 PaaI family thioesterase [Amaricoccus solimangrovi]